MVDVADIEGIVAAWTGIPVERMGEDEMGRLANLVRGAPHQGRGEEGRGGGRPLSSHPVHCAALSTFA